jgi:hypothetical protein
MLHVCRCFSASLRVLSYASWDFLLQFTVRVHVSIYITLHLSQHFIPPPPAGTSIVALNRADALMSVSIASALLSAEIAELPMVARRTIRTVGSVEDVAPMVSYCNDFTASLAYHDQLLTYGGVFTDMPGLHSILAIRAV